MSSCNVDHICPKMYELRPKRKGTKRIAVRSLQQTQTHRRHMVGMVSWSSDQFFRTSWIFWRSRSANFVQPFTDCPVKGSHHFKKIYFAKKFHKTVTPPPRRGFMKAYFLGLFFGVFTIKNRGMKTRWPPHLWNFFAK